MNEKMPKRWLAGEDSPGLDKRVKNERAGSYNIISLYPTHPFIFSYFLPFSYALADRKRENGRKKGR